MMPLTSAQIQAILNEAAAAGLDPDEIEALRWVMVDQAAQLNGAERLDMALQLADEAETRAADMFLVEFAAQRNAAIARGVAELNAIDDNEWGRLINGS